jgi:transposase-like zinc-binding protein
MQSSCTPPHTTVQQVLLQYYRPEEDANGHVRQVLGHLMKCRTAALGYHLYRCSSGQCGYTHYQYHSCHDRHCPNCGALKKQQWIEARMQELLPVRYYHVVFTLPHELNSLVMGHRKLLYKLLFDACSQTLLTFAKDHQYLGALVGIISVLHIPQSGTGSGGSN